MKSRKLKLGKLKKSRKLKVEILVSAFYFLLSAFAFAQTHTMPGSNVVPSGASFTIQSGASITAAAGSTVTGFGGGGGGNVSNSGTPTAGQKATWVDATHIQGVTDNALQWDGGSTGLVAATGRTSLGLVPGTNVEVPLTFSQSLTRATNTVTLTGDSSAPGNSQYYGTNSGGTKGWFALPAAGGNVSNSGTPTVGQYGRWVTATTIEGVSTSTVKTDLSLNNVTNDAQIKSSDFPGTSVDGEISLFSGTTGKAQKRATGTGLVTATAGVYGTTTTVTGTRIDPRTTIVGSSVTAPVPDVSTTDELICTGMTVGMTFGAPVGSPVQGTQLIIRIKDNGTPQTIAWNATYKPIGVTLPTTTVAGKILYVGGIYNSTVPQWDVVAVAQE